MGDIGVRRGAQRRCKAQPVRAGKYELRPEGPTSMGGLTYPEDLQDANENTAFTWDVKANSRSYHWQFKEKVFLCWHRQKYKTNIIHTAKYNFFSFLPRNLYEQFHRVSNLYFLLIIILQGIPEISTLPWFTLFAPLVCLIIIRATRDLVDDIGRHRSDRAINNRPCQVLVGKSFIWQKWKNLCVGDVVCLSKDSIVPADLLLLASTEPSSLCYVETADIDGETNLKFRQALMVTHHELTNTRKMASFRGRVMCEEPNSRMHQFVGRLEWSGKMYPLDIGNLLLRGCKIRNTDTCYGMVIYAGFDTKIMKNCGKIHLKRTKLDLLMNKLVVLVSCQEFKDRQHYLWIPYRGGMAMESFFIFWGYLILLSVMVPMTMFIMAEFIYLGNSIFINWDKEMYYTPQDVPAKARNTSLNDQLGQVEYIFSDKTGTLTQNILTFKKCCIDGHVYGPDSESRTPKGNPYLWNRFADGKLRFHNEKLLRMVRAERDKVVQEFWRTLAICHTVMVQEKDSERPDRLVYQAASPDEEALVTAAWNFGYVFLSRTQDTITLVELGEERVYQVLAMMDFNSTRKRMSVLVRNPEGTICLYTKGADTVILERLHRKHITKLNTEEALAPLYEGWFLALFNLLYTSLPVLYIGLFEQDVSAQQSLQMPELYVAGQKDKLFNYWVFLQAIAHGTATSLVNFFMTLWISRDTAGPCSFSDYQSFAVVVALSGLLCITMEVVLIIKYWTVLCVVAILLSLSFYGVTAYVTQSYWLYRISPKTFPFLYANRNVLSCPSTALVILLNVSLNTLPILALRMIHQALEKPCPKEEAEEEAPAEEIFTVEPIPHLHRGSRGRCSSYAFSHREGYADLITQGTILRRPQGISSQLVSDSPVPSEEELLSSPNSSGSAVNQGGVPFSSEGVSTAQRTPAVPSGESATTFGNRAVAFGPAVLGQPD
ncbi:PREDICTED: phospholipid-transporting ATPase IK-like [Propithecus coquereli]|uniref:phospholipid-transporting ATPase IK-like n=1 Tax=Propithecus coquereli TaxID=379532 RepID=UPI00063F7C52|nr:PREDICTED: phospholipid-transporting ATPase IK-like [Propithecus coquereli]